MEEAAGGRKEVERGNKEGGKGGRKEGGEEK